MEKVTLRVIDNDLLAPVKEIDFMGIKINSMDPNTFVRMNGLYQRSQNSSASFSVAEVTTHPNPNGLYTVSFWGENESLAYPMAEADVSVSMMMRIIDTCRSNGIPNTISV